MRPRSAMTNRKLRMILLGAKTRHQFFDHAVFCFAIDGRARQKISKLGGFRVGFAEIDQLTERRITGSSALRQSNIRQRVGILKARGLQLGLPARPFTKALTSAS